MKTLAVPITIIVTLAMSCASWRAVDSCDADPAAEGAEEQMIKNVDVWGDCVCGEGFAHFYPEHSKEVWCISGMVDVRGAYAKIATASGERLEALLSGWYMPNEYYGTEPCSAEFWVSKIIVMSKHVPTGPQLHHEP